MMNVNDQDGGDDDDDDRIVTLSTLEEVGASGRGPYVQIDKKYNIDETTTLDIRESHFFLVSGLCNLKNLMKIKFTGLASFPAEELSRLPNLIDLHCEDCKNFAVPNSNQQLTFLKSFTILGKGPHDFNFNKWIVSSLPVLKKLHYCDYTRHGDPDPYPDEVRPGILTTLQSSDCVFTQSLQVLKISDWRMLETEDIETTIFIDLMPKFPKLRRIDTRHCFCTIVDDNTNIFDANNATIVTSTSSHEATITDDQDGIVTLSTFNAIYEEDDCGVYNKIDDREYSIDETTTLCLPTEEGCLSLLSGGIGRLKKLTNIRLHGLVSFPMDELSMLPHLEHLDFDLSICHDFDVPDSVQLKSLNCLKLENGETLHSEFNKWIVRSLPVLEELYYTSHDGQMSMYTALQRDDCVFNQSLRILEISNDFGNGIAETMLFDIIPKFPNVQHIDTRGGDFGTLENNNIFCDDDFTCASSLKNIAQRLKQIDTSNIQLRTIIGLLSGPSLRFDVTTDPIEKQTLVRDMLGGWDFDPTEEQLPEGIQAMLSILSSFRYLYNIGNYRLDPEVELMFRINHGAGALVDGPSHRNEPIPLSYLPLILERVYEQSKSTFAKNVSYNMFRGKLHEDSEFILGETNVAGMHNLVRNGPLFQHILQLGKLYVPPPPPPRRSISRKRKNTK